MRWFVYLAITGCIIWFATTYQLPNVCDNPLPYTIGSIDTRFNLSQQDLLGIIQDATNQWDNTIHKTLFAYAPQDKKAVTINMVYDERQQYSAEVSQSKQALQNEKQTLQPKMEEYKARVAAFNKRLDALNAQIEYWNQNGNITEEQYNKLIQEQKDLRQESANLNAMATSLNQSTSQYNSQIDQLNNTITNFQQVIAAKPEEGLWDGRNNTISVYYDVTRDELQHTLEHELGHSLGMEHVSDKNAIMYAQTNKTLIPAEQDVAQLQQICTKETVYDRYRKTDWNQEVSLIQERLAIILSRLTNR